MKRLLYIVALSLTFVACKKDKNENPCKKPSLDLYTQPGSVVVNVGGGDFGFYEIEYGPNGFAKGTGTIQTISGSTSISSLTDGTYDFYARGNCGGTQWSDWTGPKSCLVEGNPPNNCNTPNNIYMSGYTLYWSHPGADFYEVEYGPIGFTLGSGTKQTVNSTSFSDGTYAANTTYDLYVRAYCGPNQWSAWSTPKSFFATGNHLMCLPPTNVDVEYFGGSSVTFNWDYNGEDNWEAVLLTTNGNPNNGTIYARSSPTITYSSINSSTTYYFYVRAVCKNGSRTAWFGPKIW